MIGFTVINQREKAKKSASSQLFLIFITEISEKEEYAATVNR
jgi:hypothetical protein